MSPSSRPYRPALALALGGALALLGCGDGRASGAHPAPGTGSASSASAGPADAPAQAMPGGSPMLEGAAAAHEHLPALVGRCAAATAPGLDDDARLDALLDEAGRQLEAQSWADAFTCADMAADRAPRSIEAHHQQAAALAGAGRDDEAALAYGIALALDPDDPETLRGAADFYVNGQQGKSRAATQLGLELARRGSQRAAARRRRPTELRAQLALLEAQALADLGQAEPALERATEAARLAPTLMDAVHERGVALFNLGRFDEARVQFEKVLATRADDPYAHHLLGLTLEQLGRPADAAVHLSAAQALAPDEFRPPVEMTRAELEAEVARLIAALPPERRAHLAGVPVAIVDLPDPVDLRAVSPPLPPTILGLYRGLPLGAEAAPGEDVPPRAIVLYRLNLARAVRTRAELLEQVARTLEHEIGHLEGLDEDDLRRIDLE